MVRKQCWRGLFECPPETPRGERSYPLDVGMSIDFFHGFFALTQPRESGYLSLLRIVPETVVPTQVKPDEAYL